MRKGETSPSLDIRDELFKTLLRIESRISKLEARMDDMEKEIRDIKQELSKRNGYFKYMIILITIILSFVAAMFGMGWRPPT